MMNQRQEFFRLHCLKGIGSSKLIGKLHLEDIR